jgi:hypothetical protein
MNRHPPSPRLCKKMHARHTLTRLSLTTDRKTKLHLINRFQCEPTLSPYANRNCLQALTTRSKHRPLKQRWASATGYRQAIGELVFAMTVGRIDISYPIIKLSLRSPPSPRPTTDRIFLYLNATRDHGLTYWRTEPDMKQNQISTDSRTKLDGSRIRPLYTFARYWQAARLAKTGRVLQVIKG